MCDYIFLLLCLYFRFFAKKCLQKDVCKKYDFFAIVCGWCLLCRESFYQTVYVTSCWHHTAWNCVQTQKKIQQTTITIMARHRYHVLGDWTKFWKTLIRFDTFYVIWFFWSSFGFFGACLLLSSLILPCDALCILCNLHFIKLHAQRYHTHTQTDLVWCLFVIPISKKCLCCHWIILWIAHASLKVQCPALHLLKREKEKKKLGEKQYKKDLYTETKKIK